MTDQEQAEQVLHGLANTQACECGVVHQLGIATISKHGRPSTEYSTCDCGLRHHWKYFNCKCGATTTWGPRMGWRTTSRKKACWQRRENALRARIAELEMAMFGAK